MRIRKCAASSVEGFVVGSPSASFGTTNGSCHQREDRARPHGDSGPADNLQHAQRMSYLHVPPLIPAYHGDAEHFHLWRLDHQENRLQVAASRACAVLIDNDLAAGLAPSNWTRQTKK